MLLWGLGVRTLFVCCRDQTMGCHFWPERLLNRLWKSEKHLKWRKGSSDPCPNSAAISAAVNISWQVFWDGAVVPWWNSTLCIQKKNSDPFHFCSFCFTFWSLTIYFHAEKKSVREVTKNPNSRVPEVLWENLSEWWPNQQHYSSQVEGNYTKTDDGQLEVWAKRQPQTKTNKILCSY